jgi:hypothetical protein
VADRFILSFSESNNNKNNNNNNNKYKTFHGRNNMTCTVPQTVYIEELQNYMPTNTVCFRYIIVNILHKGDNNDANNNNNKV